MAELPVEMPNRLNFPMGKLCYDLVLEVIDELDPKDVPELMKVDRRFRWILLQQPARIIGKQIHLISVEMDDRETLDDERKRYHDLVFIMKFAESRPLPFYFWSHKLLLLSQVERCSFLFISDVYVWYDWGEQELSALKKAFANLKQVDDLEVSIWGDNFNDFLLNLKAEVTVRALLYFFDIHGEREQQLMLSLINGSLQNCKMISVKFHDGSEFYPTLFSALSKTQLELFVTEVRHGEVKSTIESILNSGIPSENKEAACFVRGEFGVEIRNWIKNFPEIRQVNEPNKTFIGDTMMETLKKHRFMDNHCDRSRPPSPRPRSVSVSAESLSVSDDFRSDSDESRSDSDDSRSDSDESRSDSDESRSDSDDSRSDSDESRSDSDDSRSDSDESRSDSDESRSDSDDSRSDSDESRFDSDDSRSDSDDSRSDSDDSLSVSAESEYCDRSLSHSPPPPPPPAPPRSRSVSVPAESLSFSGDSHSDSDDSLHSLDRSPAKRGFVVGRRHRASVDGPFDCYLKRVDEKRDCIYFVNDDFFFAKYVASIQF